MLTDRSGEHYPFRVVNTKFIITIGKYDNAGTLQTVDFIIDGACPFNIISEDNAEFGFDSSYTLAFPLWLWERGVRAEGRVPVVCGFKRRIG